MAFKKVADLNTDVMVDLEKPGQSITGHYLGNYPAVTKMGATVIHVFSTPDGNVGLWGSADLNKKLAVVTPIGSLTEVSYQKKISIPGGKTKKIFDVGYDDQDVDGSAPAIQAASDNVPDDAGDEVQADDEQQPDEVPPPRTQQPKRPAATARPVSNDRRSAMQNLMNTNKR